MLKKLIIQTKNGVKFIVLFIIAVFLIVGTIIFLYKPTYSVYIQGEQVGYTENKTQLQKQINDYIKNGEQDSKNVAFVQVEELPEYELCLLKKDVVTNDEEIYNKVKEQGVTYYRYYAIADNQQEKYYVSNFEEAEKVVNSLKEKQSSNINNISIIEKYETEMKDLTDSQDVVSKMYVAPVQKTKVAKTNNTSSYVPTGPTTMSSNKLNLGISLINPVVGTISSRFGSKSSIRKSAHTGLDIAAPTGTPIIAASSGTVIHSGNRNNGYGNYIILSHGNGIQTYYAHCSQLLVSNGQTVSQGQLIGKVGSTGNSTGPHLHFEVRVNGTILNPQNYVY